MYIEASPSWLVGYDNTQLKIIFYIHDITTIHNHIQYTRCAHDFIFSYNQDKL